MESSILLQQARKIVPQLLRTRHKGQSGRIGIVGGSLEYTGAPYFAAISALMVGADLVHVFCAEAAAPVIKSYSPELIVHPVLDTATGFDQMKTWIDRLHLLVIGPGLGRNTQIMERVSALIGICRDMEKPLIIDADGLFLIGQDRSLIQDYPNVILTPNKVEFERLFGSDRNTFAEQMKYFGQKCTVLEKGFDDLTYESATGKMTVCGSGGSGRRCGGQGDLLSGAIATFYHWALMSGNHTKDIANPALLACYAGSILTKQCNAKAYSQKGRSMVTGDMIKEIHTVFEELFENQLPSDE